MKTIQYYFIILTMLIINCCSTPSEMTVLNKDPIMEVIIDNSSENSDLDDSQDDIIIDSHYPFYYYEPLWFRVQDDLGNDLIKRIGSDWWLSDSNPTGDPSLDGTVNPNLYSIEYVYPFPKMSPFYYLQEEIEFINETPCVIWDEYVPIFYIFIDKDVFYMGFSAKSMKYYDGDLPPAGKIIFKLNCPSIFGDNKVYEIITYWEQLTIDGFSNSDSFKCVRIEFCGQEINFQRIPDYDTDKNDFYSHSVATIILNLK